MATPHLYINPPFQGYPPFLANVLVPPPPPPLKWPNFLKVLPPSINKGKGGGGGSLLTVLLAVKSNKNGKRALEISFLFSGKNRFLWCPNCLFWKRNFVKKRVRLLCLCWWYNLFLKKCYFYKAYGWHFFFCIYPD